MLPLRLPHDFVDNMLINFLLRHRNYPSKALPRLYAQPFLPTMKAQHSQLP